MKVTERFIKYTAFGTASAEGSVKTPSTDSQKELAKVLAAELESIGAESVRLDGNGYVYACIPASAGLEKSPVIGLIAHLDTTPETAGEGVKARIIHYEGGDIVLDSGAVTRTADCPELEEYAGCDLIVTDGTTLLGADDKAGIAEIISAAEYLTAHPEIKHGRVALGFTPDEEIGNGAERFDFKGFGADYAYTVDGTKLGEIEYENFNGATACITIKGLNIHTGYAKGRMRNSLLIANELISMLPPDETPAETEGREGFYHVESVCGDVTETKIEMLLRDFEGDGLEKRQTLVSGLVGEINRRHGRCAELYFCKQYFNMKEKILPHIQIIKSAEDAMRSCGVEPEIIAIRGGTDGARLSYEGLPCPNLSTGGLNIHSVHEFIPVFALQKMTDVLVEILKIK